MRVAAYARYSSDSQRDASLEDQLRNCRGYCTRQGWPAPAVFSDAAISGSRNDRPGYRQLLAAAAGFDVVLVDDLSRLSRDSVEAQQQVRRLKFAGVRVIAISDGIDTADKGHKAGVGLRGLMSELYLDDLAEKTHRGLTGRALSGASAGGLPYGYRCGEKAGERLVDPLQAEVVRRIFADYLAGLTPRQIAAGLNRDGVRSARSGGAGTWAVSAIHGDVKRGIGILANPIYVGRQVWNRSRWTKHPDTGRRIRQERPREEWITTEHPELAIVDRATWDAVQARIRGVGVPNRGTRGGRPAKHLLSGLLRCGDCGGPLAVIDAKAYGCSTAKDRGTCTNRMRLPRLQAEKALLAGVQEQLLGEEAFTAFRKAYTAASRSRKPDTDGAAKRLADAERVRENLMAALRAGIITPGTKAELLSAEAKVADAQRELEQAKAVEPVKLLPQLRARWDGIVSALAQRARNLPAARQALQSLVGEAIVRNENGAIFCEIAPCPLTVVAGAGFDRYLIEPVRIQLGRG